MPTNTDNRDPTKQDSNENRHTKLKNLLSKGKKGFKRNGFVLFVLTAIFIGARTFLEIVRTSLAFPWRIAAMIAAAVAIVKLPRVVAFLRKGNDPILIIFAKAFKKGFFGVKSILPSLSSGVSKLKAFWASLQNSPDDS